MRLALALLFVFVTAAATATTAEAQTEIKVATLAPAGSAWARIMADGATQLEAATQGRVKLHYYFSGSQGDERDVVRKMKLGQLDGAALTAVGLGLIQPDVLVLQLPFMFKNDKQIDQVREKLGPDFEKEFTDAGYTLVSWGDVGWVVSYSQVNVTTLAELQKVKTWVWVDDPIVRDYFTVLGVNAVPLGVPEVLTSLETGAVQAVYGPPLAALALQWYTKVKYMTDQEAGYGVGAMVVRKEVMDKLSPADRAIFLQGGKVVGQQLLASVRRDNARAKAAMLKAGIQVIHVPDDARMFFEVAGKQVWDRLAGKVYSKEWLEKVKKTVAETPE
jgi:TRAP-type C4-dicarboxylate transport system substrate-binding protein